MRQGRLLRAWLCRRETGHWHGRLSDIDPGRSGQLCQSLRAELEHRVRMPGRSPYRVKTPQRLVQHQQHLAGMGQRRDAAYAETRSRLDEGRVGAAQALAIGADQGFEFFFVHTLVARCHHHHGHVIGFAPEHDTLGNLPRQNAQAVGRLLRCTRRITQHQRHVCVAALLQKNRDALHALGQGLQLSAAHKKPPRLSLRVLRCPPRGRIFPWGGPAEKLSLTRSLAENGSGHA